MSLKQANKQITEDAYLQTELVSEIKHEYVNGQIHAMTGASVNHNRVAVNISRCFGNQLEGKSCEVFNSDMKLKVAGEYRYPDVMVVCDKDFGDDGYSTKTPIIIVEVLSKSTRKIDKTKKFMTYINIPTLKEYVLIEQDIVDIEVCRKSNGWKSEHYYLGDSVNFEAIELTVSVEEIYSRVDNEDMDMLNKKIVCR